MTAGVAIAAAYSVVVAGILLYLRRVHRRLREVEADMHALQSDAGPREPLTVR